MGNRIAAGTYLLMLWLLMPVAVLRMGCCPFPVPAPVGNGRAIRSFGSPHVGELSTLRPPARSQLWRPRKRDLRMMSSAEDPMPYSDRKIDERQREIAAIDRELVDINAVLSQLKGRPEEPIVRDAREGLLRARSRAVIDLEKLGRLERWRQG
jgi:hypothetical protein